VIFVDGRKSSDSPGKGKLRQAHDWTTPETIRNRDWHSKPSRTDLKDPKGQNKKGQHNLGEQRLR
jgi:hypothetical protein